MLHLEENQLQRLPKSMGDLSALKMLFLQVRDRLVAGRARGAKGYWWGKGSEHSAVAVWGGWALASVLECLC